jgi:hypothetical protein
MGHLQTFRRHDYTKKNILPFVLHSKFIISYNRKLADCKLIWVFPEGAEEAAQSRNINSIAQ